MKILKPDGSVFYEGARLAVTEIESWGVPLPDGATIAYTVREQRDMIRANIAETAGDELSLIGTINDGATLLLWHFAKLTQGLAAATTLAEVRDATADFAPLADAFIAMVVSGDVKLPFNLKGEEAVMAEIETRATAVADALIAAQNG